MPPRPLLPFSPKTRFHTFMRKARFVALTLLVGILAVIIFLIPQRTVAPVSGGVSSSFSSAAEAPDLHQGVFFVTRVVDGDTIDVRDSEGTIERVRFIGIDTPETVDERKPMQCYGPEASTRMKELLEGESVELSRKPEEDRDDYNRLLRYVFLREEDIGAQMIEEGFARSVCIPFPHPKCEEYAALEKSARAEKRGRWGACL